MNALLIFLSLSLSLPLSLSLAAPATADTILITEVVTDPQQDHSESAAGNGTPYDPVPGTGTVSSVDEYVELYNASLDPIDLTSHVVWFNDSTPTSYTFGVTRSGVTRYSPGSSLTNLLSGGFVLIGNPPGAINNRITVEVHDPSGNKLNTLDVQDGNAANAASEAVARIWDGNMFLRRVFRDSITPLGVSNPAPLPIAEPSAVVLLLLSGLGAAAGAIRRRVARVSGQRHRGSPRTPACPA